MANGRGDGTSPRKNVKGDLQSNPSLTLKPSEAVEFLFERAMDPILAVQGSRSSITLVKEPEVVIE